MATRKSDDKKTEERTESRLATEENTPEQPLGTDDPADFKLSDLAPAPSGDMDHLNPGVPGDLPNELPARVPDEKAIGGGIGPVSRASATVPDREEPKSTKSRK
jgi:hypothetical protein